MTLTEILWAYRNMVQRNGREGADKWLFATVDASLLNHIKESVSDSGEFIDAEGFDFHLE